MTGIDVSAGSVFAMKMFSLTEEAEDSVGTLVAMHHTTLDQNIRDLDLVSHSSEHLSSHIIYFGLY